MSAYKVPTVEGEVALVTMFTDRIAVTMNPRHLPEVTQGVRFTWPNAPTEAPRRCD